MEVWILYGDDIQSSADLAFEVRRFLSVASKMDDIDLKVLEPQRFDLVVTEEVQNSILYDGEPIALPDVVFPYFNHSDHSYFSVAIVRQLERQGVTIFNSSHTIETVRDKLHTHQILAEAGLPTPMTMLAKYPIDIELVEEKIGFPLIVKTLKGALGSGVFLIHDHKHFEDFIEMAGEMNPHMQLIFQQFVKSSTGRDLRLFVVNGDVIGAMERRAGKGQFKANYSRGAAVVEFLPDQQARDLAVKAAELLNIQVAGIDLLFTDGGYTICEANTFPGFKGLESCCNINVAEEIFKAMLKWKNTDHIEPISFAEFEEIRSLQNIRTDDRDERIKQIAMRMDRQA